MDIAGIKPEEITRDIVHPSTGLPLGIKVTVVQFESEKTKTARRQAMDARLKKDSKNKTMKAEEVEETGHNLLYACMSDWEWKAPLDSDGKPVLGTDNKPIVAPTFEGKVPDFNLVMVKKVFKKLPWFQSQVDAIVDEAADFFEG